jgi:apolipoprotein N-acyltransferase
MQRNLHDGLLACLSGALLALAFPRFGHPVFAWIALAPGWAALARHPRPAWSRALLLGLLTGFVYFGGTLYWLPEVMVTFGGLARPVAIAVAGLLVAYLALFPGAAAAAIAVALRRYGLPGLWLAPLAWVGAEWVRGWLFTGFPWVALGYSQATVIPVIQLASVVGVLGVSGLVAFVSAALAHAVVAPRRTALAGLAVAAAMVAATAAWGAWRVARGDLVRGGTLLRVGIVQGNVPQDEKWDPGRARQILTRYLDLTRSVAGRGAVLVVWPESATPFYFEEDPAGETVRAAARETGAYLLFGSDQIERGPVPRYYNAAFLLDPAGRTVAVYRKRHLVPFGEYVPLKRLLFFVSPLVEAVSDFSPGTGPVLMDVGGHAVSAAICYEAVFEYLAREAVERGSQLLITLTNDAWYGRSSAPWQHFEQASVRAVEQGRYLVRAANTGVSGIVDPYGRAIARTDLFETTALAGEVRLHGGRTVYGRMGDSFAWASAAVAGLAVVVPGGGARRRSHRSGRRRR